MGRPVRCLQRVAAAASLLLAIAAMLLPSLPLRTAHAASFIVTTLADSGPGSLRQAMLDAQAMPGEDNISFSVSGVLTLSSGLPLITGAGGKLTIDGFDAVTIDGDGLHQPFQFGAGADVRLLNLTIRDGRGSLGGAIVSSATLLALDDVRIFGNLATTAGGGIHQTGGTLVLEDSSVTQNDVADTAGPATLAGGGIYATGGATVSVLGQSRVARNHVTASNSSSSATGGGIHLESGTLVISDSSVSGNSATKLTGDRRSEGGGMFSRGPLTISNTSIRGNSSGDIAGVGGGIVSLGGLTIIGSTIAENIAREAGGIFHAGPTAGSIVQTGLVDNDAALFGGGIINTTTLSLVNSTLTGNRANLGGGVFNDDSLSLRNTTISHNTATLAGGGINGPSITMRNSIVANNTGPTGPDCAAAPVLVGPNLIGNTTGCFFSGTAPITGDPLLTPLADYGSATLTRGLLAGSPALNVGDGAVCAAAPVSGVDQRGVVRPQGPACDLGAYETEPVGGKNFSVTTNSIDTRWNPGLSQESYTLLKYNTSSASAELIPLAGNAISYSDAAAVNGIVYCYVLAALGPGSAFLGLSDLLCGMTGLQSGTAIPQDFALKLGGTSNATMTWAVPVGGADSYLLQRIPLDGSPITNVPLDGEATTTTQPVTVAGTCFQLIGFKGAGFGTSDVLCGVPGVGTLGDAGSGRAAAAGALESVANRLRGAMRLEWGPVYRAAP